MFDPLRRNPGVGDGRSLSRGGRPSTGPLGPRPRPPVSFAIDGHHRATTTTSSASRGARPTTRSSAPSASSPSSGIRTSTRTRRPQERFKEINEAYQVLSDPAAAPALRHVRARRASAARAGRRAFDGLRRLRRHLRRVLRRRPAAGAARRGRPQRRRGPALRPADHVRGGHPRHREGDRVPRAPAVRDLRAATAPSRAPSRSPARSATAAARSAASARRCSARWSTSPTCPRCQGEGKIVETPCETCQGDGRTERKRTLRVTIPAGIDEGHQIRLSGEGEVGPRGGPPGSLYVAVHVAAAPDAQARGHRALLRGRRHDRPGGARDDDHGPDRRRRGGGRDQAGHPARTRRSGCAARACRTCAGPGSRGDLHVLVDVVVPTKLTKRQRELLTELRRRGAARTVGHGGPAASATKLGLGVERRRRATAQGAWLELSVEADVEAVEAVSEILGRVAPGGDERGARLRPGRGGARRARRPDAAGHRPRLSPGPRPAAARGRGGIASPRRSATSRRSGCGRSASCGPGSSTRPTGPNAWKAYFPVLRVGRRLVIRPTLAPPPARRRRRRPRARSRAWRSGPACTRRRGCASRARGARGPRRRARRARGSSTSAAAPGSWRSRRSGSGRPRARRRRHRPDRHRGDGRQRAAQPARATDPRPRRHPAERRAAVRRRARQPDRRRARAAGRPAPRRAAAGRHARSRRGSSSTARPRSARPSRRPACAVDGALDRGRLGGARGASGRPEPTGPGAYNRAPMPILFPLLLVDAHHAGDQPVPAVDPAAVRAADAPGDRRVGQPRRARPALGARAHGTIVDRARAGADRARARRVARARRCSSSRGCWSR